MNEKLFCFRQILRDYHQRSQSKSKSQYQRIICCWVLVFLESGSELLSVKAWSVEYQRQCRLCGVIWNWKDRFQAFIFPEQAKEVYEWPVVLKCGSPVCSMSSFCWWSTEWSIQPPHGGLRLIMDSFIHNTQFMKKSHNIKKTQVWSSTI